MKIDSDKSHAVLIDKETGKVHDLGEVTVTKLDGGSLLPDDVLPKDFDAQKSYTWTLKLSKRKVRKLKYAMKHLWMPSKRKYIPKRDMIRLIKESFTSLSSDLIPDDFYAKLSHKQLLIVYRNFYAARQYSIKKFAEQYGSN